MIKKILILFGAVALLSFTSCGDSSKEARELLSKILNIIGIPHNILVTVCQDNNNNGTCERLEVKAKLTINKGDSREDIWKKITQQSDGTYLLETLDITKPILLELQDPKNIHHNEGKFTLRFNGFENEENFEKKELSAIESLEDAGYLTEVETRKFKSLENRESLDYAIFSSLENNYNLLKNEKLSTKDSLEQGMIVLANGLQKLDISTELPDKLTSCANDQNCIKKLITVTSRELNITKEEAEIIADEIKKENRPISQKNVADGYIVKLSTPVEARCSNQSYSSLTSIGERGAILFDTDLIKSNCLIIVPSSATIDSNNNGRYEESDKPLGFIMKGTADSSFITPLTTLVVAKQLKGENISTFKTMVKDFNPVSAASAVVLYTGEKKNRVQKLIILMEILKIALRNNADISGIDLSQILSNILAKDMDIDKLIAGLSDSIRLKIIEGLNIQIIKDLVLQLDKFDKTKINMNTLLVNISDGGQSLEDAIVGASKIILSLDENVVKQVLKDSDTEGNIEEEIPEEIITPPLTIGTSSITGKVKNAVSNEAIGDVSIKLYKNHTFVKEVKTDSLGIYLLSNFAEGNYSLDIIKENYLTVKYQNIELDKNITKYLETVLHIEKSYIGLGDISGTITDSIDGQGLSGVMINFRKGINTHRGEIVQTITTGGAGQYNTIGLEAGSYTGELTSDGYQVSYITVVALGGRTNRNQNGSINPLLQTGETRIVLTWGETPRDLDSHITGPLVGDSRRFHIYFGSKGHMTSSPYTNLDTDDVSSYGPETVTIRTQKPGSYKYFVYDYSNGGKSSSFALGNSGAKVKVYRGVGLVAEFFVPNQEGTVWEVLEIRDNTVTPINSMSYNHRIIQKIKLKN